MLVYIILVEVFIVGNMKEKDEIFKTIYLNYMPDFVVSKEKIIKAKLHVEGFLEKWLFRCIIFFFFLFIVFIDLFF